MKIPMELKHKPVFVCSDYERIDGRKAYDSDAKGLTLGLAQWNDRGKVDISAKVWRYTGEKWSRQSEELPLHRVIDLAILICRAKQYLNEEYHAPAGVDGIIDRVGLQGDAMTVALALENPMLEEDKKLFFETLSKDDEMLSQRLNVLANMLREMNYGSNR